MPVQVVNVRRDAFATDLLVELECLAQRPAMLEGVQAPFMTDPAISSAERESTFS
jgi:hypothetical protein